MCRKLLDEGRRQPKLPVRRHDPAVAELVGRLHAEGRTWQPVADAVADTVPDERAITRHAVAALHGLRHTWATLALHEGIDIQVVNDRLNHSSTHVTCEIYTHVTPPMQTGGIARDRRLPPVAGACVRRERVWKSDVLEHESTVLPVPTSDRRGTPRW